MAIDVQTAPARPAGASANPLPARRRARPRGLRRWLLTDVKGIVGLLLLVALGFATLLGPVVLGIDPLQQDLRARLVPPVGAERASLAHLLGTDQLGRDLLARILLGGQLSILIGLSASALAAVLGVSAGLVAGFAGRHWDAILMGTADVQLAFPSILLALAVMVVLGPGLGNLIAVLAISSWVFQARIIRAEVLSLKQRDFVMAGRALGAPDSYLLIRHILPNVSGSMLVLFTLTIVRAILAESSLSFLGLGIQPPQPSWGGMLAEGRQYLATAWWVGTLPGCALMLALVATNLVGDSLRDMLDPRIQREGG
jgi:peptide/nickel transport system permease protein